MTAFEQLCAQLGAAPESGAAEVISAMVNDLIFSDSCNYTDEEIVAIVAARYRRWEEQSKQPEINQGFKIVAAETYNEEKQFRIVLARRETQFGTNWVTWESKRDSSGLIDYFWGHYHDNEKAARIDYHRRLLSYYEG